MSNTNFLTALTPQQLERYNALHHIYGERAAELVSYVKGRGKRSWRTVQANAQRINNPSSMKQIQYDVAIDQSFDLNEVYSFAEITQIISQVRFSNDLPPFHTRIESLCETEFLMYFIADDVYDAPKELGGKLIGYKPIFRIKA
ncbi:hypothetical protein [Hufsiella ginkgonis]|uniref:Uncharacterized protein n=1 Tax=Hufsiella ginkgonis TaxID=2695274 RepID=A0A7K1Y381_9SPHI|nr:hypothetical protein [Hufsiella ginkgonis]MXV17720.1 hypothetical protein [Hufsiella ginkgonis]